LPAPRDDDTERTLVRPPGKPAGPAPAPAPSPPPADADPSDELTIRRPGPVQPGRKPPAEASPVEEATLASGPPAWLRGVTPPAPDLPPEPAPEKIPEQSPEGPQTLQIQGAAVPPPTEVTEALAKLRPRLLVLLGGTKQIHDVTQVPFIIGRDPQVNCRIQHDTVSGSHAIVDFDGKSFTIEDLGSKNSSKLGNTALKKGQKYELPPESALRFAAAEALFFLEGPEEPRAARALQDRAGDILVRDGKVARAQKKEAARGSRRDVEHLGARLILEADVRPSDWSDAARRGREGVGGGFSLWLLLWLLLALAAGTAAGWLLYWRG